MSLDDQPHFQPNAGYRLDQLQQLNLRSVDLVFRINVGDDQEKYLVTCKVTADDANSTMLAMYSGWIASTTDENVAIKAFRKAFRMALECISPFPAGTDSETL